MLQQHHEGGMLASVELEPLLLILMEGEEAERGEKPGGGGRGVSCVSTLKAAFLQEFGPRPFSSSWWEGEKQDEQLCQHYDGGALASVGFQPLLLILGKRPRLKPGFLGADARNGLAVKPWTLTPDPNTIT